MTDQERWRRAEKLGRAIGVDPRMVMGGYRAAFGDGTHGSYTSLEEFERAMEQAANEDIEHGRIATNALREWMAGR